MDKTKEKTAEESITKDNILKESSHWADIWSGKILRERSNQEVYTCAAGITPSGTVHIGNFREIISVALVVRALQERGKNVRFIYSWDDYDVFRKVPQNMPQQDLLAKHLRYPITQVPDVFGEHESYAARNEAEVMAQLPIVGIFPEYIYQSREYQSSRYAEGIRTALQKKELIRRQLNEFRKEDLPSDWFPVSVFCTQCHRDTTTVDGSDGEYEVQYHCECGNQESLDLRKTGAVKLPWRIDWPMRWREESVDFEPAGKDHHSEGGSFDTARKTAKEIFGYDAPLTFQYDFVRIKGGTGKISSSLGEVISLKDVLAVYEPEVMLTFFSGTRPNSEFAISFDLDVIKNYEEYDKLEREYYNPPTSEKALKKWYKRARIYELSQVVSREKIPSQEPFQIAFRHLCTLIQIHDGDFERVWQEYGNTVESDKKRLKRRADCVLFWLKHFADEEFCLKVRSSEDAPLSLLPQEREILEVVEKRLSELPEEVEESDLNTTLYAILHEFKQEPKVFFSLIYRALINKEKGPKITSFIKQIGLSRTLSVLREGLTSV